MSSDPESTAQLIERARAGDTHAIDRLVSRHLRPLQRWATGRLPHWARSTADTDDLVQDTLIQTFRRIDGFEPRRAGALQAYLREAVRNRIRDELRRQGKKPDIGPLPEDAPADSRSPLELAIGREALDRYEQALAALSPAEREAVIGRLEMGYTYQELAEALGRPTPEAARKAAERALLRLAEELQRGRR